MGGVLRVGEGMSELAVANRATIANMSPEYGATMGFFPVDHVTLEYLKLTGRTDEKVTSIFQPTVAYAFSKKHLDGSHMLWSVMTGIISVFLQP